MAGQPGPVQGVLAFFDPLLRRTSAIVEAEPNVEIRDEAEVYSMRVREVVDSVERQRLWDIAVAAYPPYQEYQDKTDRVIPVFISEATG